MTLRVNTLITHLRPEDAYLLIDFLDQLRAMLLQTYGDEIAAMLQAASQQQSMDRDAIDDTF